jgi:phage tail tape-measure protein
MQAQENPPVRHEDGSDVAKGAAAGGIGGAIVGGAAGAMLGPVGVTFGALIGGWIGAAASGYAVEGVDEWDDDSTVTGFHEEAFADKTPTEGNPPRPLRMIRTS